MCSFFRDFSGSIFDDRAVHEPPNNTPDFTGDVAPSTTSVSFTGNPEFDNRIHELVKDWGCPKGAALIEEMIGTVLKMGRDKTGEGDLKLFTRSLKELRYAARVFEPYSKRRKIAIFGSARTPSEDPAFQHAQLFARKMREAGFMIITGGGDGIMGAAQQGAGRDESFGLNIKLPFEQRANPTIDGDPKLINFNYFFTRKLNFVKETHALALFPGGFGTLDEGFECITLMQTGKARVMPIVMIDEPGSGYWSSMLEFAKEQLLKRGLISGEDLSFFKATHDIDEGVREVLHFYKNFHSYRYAGHLMVIRLNHRLTKAAEEQLNDAFPDLLKEGRFEQGTAHWMEKNEPELLHKPRLIFAVRRKNFGRLRQLINAINDSEVEKEDGKRA